MKASEIVNHIVNTKSVALVRARKEEHIKGQPIQYDIKESFTGKKKGWFYFDLFTASAVQQVFNAIKPENQKRFDCLPLPRLVDITWQLISK